MIQSKSKIRLLLGWETEKVQQLCHDALHTANNRDFYILDRWWTVRGWGGWVSGGGGGGKGMKVTVKKKDKFWKT